MEEMLKMKKPTRKIMLTIGVTTITISLIGEISTISLIMFFIGILGVTLIFEKQIDNH